MRAEDYFRDGNLHGALDELQQQIRQAPENSRYRTFLFQLLAILGLWERAFSQLEVLDKLDKRTWPMVHSYRGAIHCEVLRADIFAGRKQPLIFGEPPAWMALLMESLRLSANAQYVQAIALRDQAFDQAVECSGTIDDKTFRWIADADSRLGPVFELILNGRYYWVPIQRIRSIQVTQAADLRDFVWLPALFTWINGGETYGLIPTRYPGSERAEDAALQLARTTQWKEVAEGVYQGIGQRMLTTDMDDYPLLGVREIRIDTCLS